MRRLSQHIDRGTVEWHASTDEDKQYDAKAPYIDRWADVRDL
jgi:hypothetical protein